jgi:sugar lactone lactonase YvrE
VTPNAPLKPPSTPARSLSRARRAVFVLLAAAPSLLLPCAISACGSSDAEPAAAAGTTGAGGAGAGGSSGAAGSDPGGAAGAAGAEPAVGTVESFTELTFASEGIALARDAKGAPALYLGGANAIWTLTADRTLTRLVDVPSPLGSARTASGDLVVCGKLEGDAGKGEFPGAIWHVTPDGKATVQTGGGTDQFVQPNMIAVAPDDSVVFSDSKLNKVFHTAPDGSGATVLTDAITYANGVAFSPDGKTLYVASYDTKRIYSLARAADGSFSAPEVFAEDVPNVDGISPLASGDLLLVTTGSGVVRYAKDGTKTTVAAPTNFSVPSNGAFGEGELGDRWLYTTSVIQKEVRRAYVGEQGLTLPVR